MCALLVLCASCGDDGGDGAPDAAAGADAAGAPDAADCTPFQVLFFDHNGGTYTPGPNDSSNNTSAILSEEKTVAPHQPPTGHWDATMECLRTVWAPYNVLVTDQDPGASPHMEIVVTTTSSMDLIGSNAGTSISPFSCDVVEGGISFVFAKAAGETDPIAVCEAASFSSSKMMGLDNVLGCPDVNTWMSCAGQTRVFTDMDLPCGEFEARDCNCSSGTTQNSHQVLLDTAGAACE